jgi:hypothetical protein
MVQCANCGRSDIGESAVDCPTCNERLGFPNVRAATEAMEMDALRNRCERAVERAKTRGAVDRVHDFANAVAKSFAVINCDLYRLRELVTNEKSLYTNYYQAVRAHVRTAARGDFDRHRRAVDAMLFGEYAERIIFGALSVDGKGLASYGAYTVLLREETIAKRATVLDENAFRFVQRHGLQPGNRIPLGYRATWENKRELAVAKLADAVSSTTKETEFAGILLSSVGDRAKDDFMEVHIYGTFDQHAIESVAGSSSPSDSVDKAVETVVKEHLAARKKQWIEV